ncbi:alpha/beta hydrolase [Spirulina sp. 06S082]|uniref:alpha/beta fold hydrolase n=1 Tax=Spirulina sp. 06S082 TaxID=3110248 RepID=UPI002B20A539|nr:alpha/beta hydrolase [Spirulina sp. 06S082]MEA5472022.1 alpha/beta hydrolase [Spirulina sp. 06S082]
MFLDSFASDAVYLSEETSIALAQKIAVQPIETPFSDRPISTAYVATTAPEKENIPILLLHGFDSSVFEFRRLLPLLAADREVIAVDLLGFGFTERRADIPFDTNAIKIHLHAFWQTFITKPIILVGASMGGATAIDFTLTYPEVVEKLVLLDSAGIAKPPALWKLLFPPFDRWATNFLSNAKVRENISKTAYFDKSLATDDANFCAALHLQCDRWHEALMAFTKSGGYGSFLQHLPAIAQPTLILWGRNDKILGTKDAGIFQQRIPNNKLVWIDRCGHVPHLEQPQITAEAIGQFVRDRHISKV